jgi:molybdopterin converting factor small subunit
MHVEFFGVSRDRAGIAEMDVEANTLGRLLATLSTRMPGLAALIDVDRLHPSLAASLNGDRFISDPETPLREDDHVLIVSSDAGG